MCIGELGRVCSPCQEDQRHRPRRDARPLAQESWRCLCSCDRLLDRCQWRADEPGPLQKRTLRSGPILRPRQRGTYNAEGTAIADALRANGGLTELSICGNEVGDEGVGAICEAIQSNKETKLVSLNMGHNSISPVGAKSVAAMVAVSLTGALTQVLAFSPKRCLFCCTLTHAFALNGIAAGPLSQPALWPRSSYLHRRGHHSDCRRFARQRRHGQYTVRLPQT